MVKDIRTRQQQLEALDELALKRLAARPAPDEQEAETPVFKWPKNEGPILEEMIDYVRATYGEHYVTESGLQSIDIWESLGTLQTTSRDTALKYLMRYGKKGGRNRKDLMKALHYVVLMIYAHDKTEKTDGTQV